eukprot:5236879-Pleurochrysis_carterae.AAC.1
MRVPETDVLLTLERALGSCRRAEASLTPHFPELRHLGANSSGLSAVSGAAHMMLAILLARQAILCLLSDFENLQSSHEDADSAFNLQQLGRPREVVDLLKLAFHSSEGGGAANSSAFDKLWGVMQGLTRGGGDGTPLPTPFKALPVLLRDDALAHVSRELRGVASWQSAHPLSGSRLHAKTKLHVPGALSLRVQLDRRSDLGGRATLVFSRDEAGSDELARWHGADAADWQPLLVHDESVWIALSGEGASGKHAKKLWGFRVQAVAEGWLPPAGESQALETPLSLGWRLLQLLCEHRPAELLTRQTFLTLSRYVHTSSAPQLVIAASLLVRLLKLPPSALPEPGNDPRDAWPMERMLALSGVVEAHKRQQPTLPGELLPLHIQLFAELSALAHLRTAMEPSVLDAPAWLCALTELVPVVRFLLRERPKEGETVDVVAELPQRWLGQLESLRFDVLLLQVARLAVEKRGGAAALGRCGQSASVRLSSCIRHAFELDDRAAETWKPLSSLIPPDTSSFTCPPRPPPFRSPPSHKLQSPPPNDTLPPSSLFSPTRASRAGAVDRANARVAAHLRRDEAGRLQARGSALGVATIFAAARRPHPAAAVHRLRRRRPSPPGAAAGAQPAAARARTRGLLRLHGPAPLVGRRLGAAAHAATARGEAGRLARGARRRLAHAHARRDQGRAAAERHREQTQARATMRT